VAKRLSRLSWRAARGRRGIITPGFRQYLEAGGVAPGRIHRVRNWHLGEPSTRDRAETRARLGWPEDAFICLHAGNMGHKQGLSNLVEAARLLHDGNVRIVLAGDGNERQRLEREAEDVPAERIAFLGPQAPCDYEAMPRRRTCCS
jgi:glycosyltransferase involved in cell wall biosynthesis